MYFDLSILNIDGLTQDERRLKALMPGHIDVDERDIADLLKFMTESAAQFNYYNLSNRPEGNWEDFFKSDIHILLVFIARFDMLKQIGLFSKYEVELNEADSAQILFAAWKDLLDVISEVLDILTELRERLAGISMELRKRLASISIELPDRLASISEESKIAGVLSGIVGDLQVEVGLLRQYTKANAGYSSYRDPDLPPAEEISGNITAVKAHILNELTDVKSIFTKLAAKCNHLLSVTNFYLKSNDLLDGNYAPHLALCITFLHLFRHLQHKLNATTKKHLDLYYKQILGFELNKAMPDSAHIVFEKEALAPDVLLKAGEELLAQLPGQQDPALFALEEDLLVTGAQITELKTLYLAEHIQIIDKKDDTVTEVQVYGRAYPCGTAASFLKNKAQVKTWPVLGQDQYDLPAAERTMDVTSLGLLLASPLLYQTEGQRAISIHISLEDGSYEDLTGYFSHYSKVSKKDLIAVSKLLLSEAFVIDYTDTKGWKEVPAFKASLNESLKRLEIEIQINNADNVVDVYKPEIHGGNFDIEWPVFRLLLNNYATNNPFTFLRNLKMERISLRANVTGSKLVKLQNNVGPLSPANPSQLFGPQPSVGSYLDIKNSNIFNKYTKTFCIRLEWIGLPKEEGGWAGYYRAYNKGIDNGSFRIRISTLSDGRFVPGVSQQEEFSLFETDDDDILSSTTQLQNIDAKRLGLNKRPLLNKDELVADKNFTEGALRIELVAPDDAFGHRSFNQIFPQTVLHNAKHFKKLPLPNQPYIPLVRALSIDYVLEHSEALGSDSIKNNEDQDLKVVHIYPFGYQQIYPGGKKASYCLIPDFDHENNLYLGLRGIREGQELSMLFQLEENNYSDLLNTENLYWSYLDDNTWVPLEDKDILLDTTNKFINSGLVKIKLPVGLRTDNTILSPQLYWIRASIKGKINVRSNVAGIYTQAAAAKRLATDDPAALNIPSGSIKMFKRKILGIQSITQPLPSFGGKITETDEQYYIRVSERLRHGQKLITARDIEQAVLESFPEILMAKCITPQEYLPFYIKKYRPDPRLILIPRKLPNGMFQSDEPRVNLSVRDQVNKYLKKLKPPFLKIDVRNPVYEKIKVICTVKFAGDDKTKRGMYIKKLNEDIKRYLCPWLYEQGSDFKIGSGIYMAEMLNFIKKRSYIEYVTGFSIVHFYYNDATDIDGEKARVIDHTRNYDVYIKGSLPESVLVPNKTHLITVEDDIRSVEAKETGIGEFLVKEELLVDRGKERTDQQQRDGESDPKAAKNFFDLIIPRELI
jgi:hypothetical protein